MIMSNVSFQNSFNFSPYGGEASVLDHGVDVLVVASHAVVVEPVANDEGIGNLHGAVIYLERSRETFWFLQEGADLHALGAFVEELGQQVVHGVARVDDVFDDDDVAGLQVGIDADEFTEYACALHSLVTGEFGEEDFGLEREFAHQVGGEHEGTVKDAHHHGVLAGIVLIEPCCHFFYFLLNQLVRVGQLEISVQNLNHTFCGIRKHIWVQSYD